MFVTYDESGTDRSIPTSLYIFDQLIANMLSLFYIGLKNIKQSKLNSGNKFKIFGSLCTWQHLLCVYFAKKFTIFQKSRLLAAEKLKQHDYNIILVPFEYFYRGMCTLKLYIFYSRT